jgi:hypothetical protein
LSFSLCFPLISFDSNEASRGRDLDTECGRLREIIPSSFSFMESSIEEEEREFSFSGRNSSILPCHYDLVNFFEKFDEDNVCCDRIYEEWKDGEYCCFVLLPCQAMKEG